jgi:hypothetical protein
MKTLLVHPEDSPLLGPWADEHWDLIVDLGRSSTFTAEQWSEHAGCQVERLDSFRTGTTDIQQVKQLFSAGYGALVDRQGLDWWKIVSLYFVAQAETVLALQRLVAELNPSNELWATRPGWPASALSSLGGRRIRYLRQPALQRLSARAGRYAGLARKFSPAQVKEIFFDKYDAGHRWRSRISRRTAAQPQRVVLIPSAYENVSRMAAAYARLVPDQRFLLVSTRRSATLFDPPANVTVRHLPSYASPEVSSEDALLVQVWADLEGSLTEAAEYRALRDAGIFANFENWLKDGLSVRDAWSNVLDSEPVCSVLCGDDSNSYTRIPMLLAGRRGLATLDFHHGALDGFYLVKDLDCSLYLAKSEMERDYLTRLCRLPAERIALAAPRRERVATQLDRKHADAIVLFSEPYENAGARGRDIYAELLPRLATLARQRGGRVIVKLHPFESAAARFSFIRSVIPAADQPLFSVIDGPLTTSLFTQAWFGVTVESTAVMDCVLNQVPCFLCEWLANPSYGYVQQFTRFGLGSLLKSADEIEGIPARLVLEAEEPLRSFWSQADPAELAQWLAGTVPVPGKVAAS